jgi:hypothetical protein
MAVTPAVVPFRPASTHGPLPFRTAALLPSAGPAVTPTIFIGPDWMTPHLDGSCKFTVRKRKKENSENPAANLGWTPYSRKLPECIASSA